MTDLYRIQIRDISGTDATLDMYRGNVLLIVNTASKCGFTGQYEGLQSLYDTYRDQGLIVLGVPSNDFLMQEPGNNDEIQSFCSINYGVTFPLLEKTPVTGSRQHPLYTYLTSKMTNPDFGGRITWNFNKFLIAKDGKIAGRFGSRVSPQADELKNAVEVELAK